jgi:predicted Rossmann fold flavoprotein
VPLRPALAPLLADMKRLNALQGVRLDVGLTLSDGDRESPRVLGATLGNVMFTQTGLSGPAAMDLSHLVSASPSAALMLAINLVPRAHDELQALLSRKRGEAMPARVWLGAALPAKVPGVLLALAGIAEEALLRDLSEQDLRRLDGLLTGLPLRVTGTRGFQYAQVSAGGVPVTEVDPTNMASRRVPGLHLAGEVLDVVGPCGGYNLQFAWTSGVLAGAGAVGS